MKIPLKYGLPITLVVVVWIVVVHYLLKLDPESKVNLLAPLLFNLAELFLIFSGIRAYKRELSDRFTFKEGVRMGTAISLVYAISVCLFFMIHLAVAGPGMLMSDMGATGGSVWPAALKAFAGLFFGSAAFGVIYSALAAFVLARQRSDD
jgi:hypothetical protein